MQFKIDSDLPQGMAAAMDATGLRTQTFRVPSERPPEWAEVTYLSPEDMGSLMRAASDAQSGASTS